MSITTELKKNASRTQIDNIFKGMKVNFNRSEWLSDTNIYKSNYVNDTNPIENADDYKEYLASSVILHLSDAWSYLNRAINASLSGDHNSARHMAYYAELRATMSILASEGIGVHDYKHYYIGRDGNINQLGREQGTHTATWEIFKAWSKNPQSKSLLEKTISYEGETIQKWISSLGVGRWNALAESLFKDWGMDLEVLAKDQKIRNGASYNPNQVLISTNLSTCDNIQFFCELWNLFCPSKTERFAMIDKELIKRSLFKVKADMPTADFNKKVSDHIGSLLYGKATMAQEISYFTTEQHSVFFEMADTSHPSPIDAIKDPASHLQIIARASLLLRLATGSSNLLISDAGINFDDINFWWNDLAVNCGIWDNTNSPESGELYELWKDIETYILEEIEEKTCNDTISLHAIKNDDDLSSNLHLFSECERIMLSGLSS